MQRSELENNLFPRLVGKACLLSGVWMAFLIAGCGGGTTTAKQTTATTVSPQTYFAPYVAGAGPLSTLAYTIDDGAGTFSQTTYHPENEVGPQVLNAGTLTVGERGLRSLGIGASYSFDSTTDQYEHTTYSTAQPGSFAVELAGQAGGFVQMVGQSVEPLVAATECPNFSSAQTYQFVTIPAIEDQILQAGSPIQQQADTWNPTTDTAYGSVDIVSSGSTVYFKNIHQYTLPSVGGTGVPAQSSSSSATGVCGPTVLGSITGVPGQYVVYDPGITSAQPPQAAIGIGPTGLLVEDNGSTSGGTLAGTSPAIHYENVLGAGTGAVGLPKPSSTLDTGAVVGAQYLGFIYGAGTVSSSTGPAVAWSSHLASFSGLSSVSTNCASFAAQTGTLSNGIYGGDFTNNDPSTSSNGFGNCDFAIDLGAQDSSNNGLYSKAKVWVGAKYAANSTGKTYFFQAVAIAGQLGGKYAVFLIGQDSTQPWAIYLLQSN